MKIEYNGKQFTKIKELLAETTIANIDKFLFDNEKVTLADFISLQEKENQKDASGSASNSGDSGSASNSGYCGSASNSGYCGSASNSGYWGSASNSGNRGSASNSGDSGSASNSGNRGSASNSGNSGSASNSGDWGSASNSGYCGSASNSGNSGSASNSGDSGSASNSGYCGSASNSGNRGSASNSGNSGSASNSGDWGSASNSGYWGSASNSGYCGSASNSGDSGSASNSGNRGSASNSGDSGSASNSGNRGSASNSGDSGSASNSGDWGISTSNSFFGKVLNKNGMFSMITEFVFNNLKVGEGVSKEKITKQNAKLIKFTKEMEGKFYTLFKNKVYEIVEIDDIQMLVLESKDINGFKVIKGIEFGSDITIYNKQTKLEDIKKLFVVEKDGVYSHGETIEQAIKDLRYKIGNRDMSAFEYLRTIKEEISVDEIIKAYRVVTGACEVGTKMFVENLGELKDKYTIKEALEILKYKNAYAFEKFEKFIGD